jgi:hypothetical protein
MKRLVSGVLPLALAAAAPAMASTFLAMDQGSLVAQADAVIQGRVLKVESFWEPTGTIIVTEAMVEVEEEIVGRTPTVVRVKTFGGEVGGYFVEAHGFPVFAAGERLLLFLEPDGEDTLRVTGYQQGQYRLVSGKDGVELAVPAVDAGSSLLTADGRQVPAPAAQPLDALKDQIRAEARRLGKSAD